MIQSAKAESGAKEFNYGYYCALAAVLREAGTIQPIIKELFNAGGSGEDASPEDKAIFRKYKLMD